MLAVQRDAAGGVVGDAALTTSRSQSNKKVKAATEDMSKLKQFAEDKSWEQTQLAQQQTTLATFNGMSNVHLRQQLQRRGLGFRGSRALLLARLQRALEDNLNRKRVARKKSGPHSFPHNCFFLCGVFI